MGWGYFEQDSDEFTEHIDNGQIRPCARSSGAYLF
jgi:hypothetical protein